MTYPGWRFDRQRPAKSFISRIVWPIIIITVLFTAVTSIPDDMLDQIHGALASASLTLGISCGAVALFLTLVYRGMSGRWPWH